MQLKKAFRVLCAGLVFPLIVTMATHALAAKVSLSWDDPHNNPANIGGYMLYYWQPDWDIPESVDIGPQTTCTLINLEAGQTYAFAVTAYDPYGMEESAYSNVVTQFLPPNNTPALEIGEVNLDHNWTRVTFHNAFKDPIVIAKPLSYNGSDPAVIRIQDVNASGFSIRIQEWDYLDDDWHTVETVSYLVMERGSYTLPDGTRIEADRFTTDQTADFSTVSFYQAFRTLPVVITAISSFDGSNAVTGRIQRIDLTGFAFRLQEQELNLQLHATERIDYIAWEPGSGTLDGWTFSINTIENIVQDQFYTLSYPEPFGTIPSFLADIQTSYGLNPATLRWTNKTSSGVDIRIKEEQSYDSETGHVSETVGYMLFEYTGLN